MNALVIGANGLLGSNVVVEALDRGQSVAGTYHSSKPAFDIPCFQTDIRDNDVIVDLIEELDPSAVINCAAMTDVDECERRPDEAYEINAVAPEELAHMCDQRGIAFVHVSTDYVFDGESSNRYAEDSDPNPVQEYGRSKLVGERGVLTSHESPLVVRLSFVYGVHHGWETPDLDGFPAWVRSRLDSDQGTPLFTDQHITPSRAGSTAMTLLDLLDRDSTGLYHVAAQSCVTPYEFGRHLAREMGIDESYLQEGSRADVTRDAARPAHTCLDVQTVEEELDHPQPSVVDDVAALADYL